MSDKASACPHCGAPYKRKHRAGFLLIPLGMVVLVLLVVAIGASKPTPETPKADQATTNRLDFAKPMSLRANARMCISEDELSAANSGAPASCVRTPAPVSVAVIDCNGVFNRTCRLRPKSGNPTDVWASVQDLMNDPD